MKPFNLEEAKKGNPVCTRCGYPVRIICFDRKGDSPIVALANSGETEDIVSCRSDGTVNLRSSKYDLVMATEKQSRWINIYSNDEVSELYKTKDEALQKRKAGVITTVEVTWEG